MKKVALSQKMTKKVKNGMMKSGKMKNGKMSVDILKMKKSVLK